MTDGKNNTGADNSGYWLNELSSQGEDDHEI